MSIDSSEFSSLSSSAPLNSFDFVIIVDWVEYDWLFAIQNDNAYNDIILLSDNLSHKIETHIELWTSVPGDGERDPKFIWLKAQGDMTLFDDIGRNALLTFTGDFHTRIQCLFDYFSGLHLRTGLSYSVVIVGAFLEHEVINFSSGLSKLRCLSVFVNPEFCLSSSSNENRLRYFIGIDDFSDLADRFSLSTITPIVNAKEHVSSLINLGLLVLRPMKMDYRDVISFYEKYIVLTDYKEFAQILGANEKVNKSLYDFFVIRSLFAHNDPDIILFITGNSSFEGFDLATQLEYLRFSLDKLSEALEDTSVRKESFDLFCNALQNVDTLLLKKDLLDIERSLINDRQKTVGFVGSITHALAISYAKLLLKNYSH